MNELQSVMSALLALLKALPKALPALTAYVVLLQILVARLREWRKPLSPTDATYLLAGIAVLMWGTGR
jgi:hypothetical protein